MKHVVDEMPYWSDDCPYHYDGGCALQHGDICNFLNPWHKDITQRGNCPYLITFKEVLYEQEHSKQ